MPTLQFKGRNIIWNHHLTVPYHTLDEVPANSYNPAKGEGNIIVEGDNLTALKTLLPQYAGKIKCIYIDPPYNTGDDNGMGKGWVYNDNVNSPVIKEWIEKEVSKDDLTKHDKWLCMLVPRLKLLRELLMDSGAIFISIDDNELEHLKVICNEIFGKENFVGQWNWYKSATPPNLSNKIKKNIEYILCYEKVKNNARYKGFYAESTSDDPMTKPNNSVKQLTFLPGTLNINIEDCEIEEGIYGTERYPNKLIGNLIVKDGTNENQVTFENKFIWLQQKLEEELNSGTRMNLSRNLVLSYKKGEYSDQVPKNLIDKTVEVETTENAGRFLAALFEGVKVFDYPKPVSLVKYLVSFLAEPNSIILDSFAGSGTTGQAVLELNKEDGGNRKFILVQMTEANDAEPDKNIARDITAERIKRAIKKYDLNSGFTYYKLGTAIDAETLLQGDLPTYEQFAKYVYYLCTGQHHSKPKEIKPKDFFVGNASNTAIYLIYEQDFDKLTQLALNLSLAEKFRKASANKPIVVYAPACFLDEEYLQDFNMQFVSIPYNLFQKNEQP